MKRNWWERLLTFDRLDYAGVYLALAGVGGGVTFAQLGDPLLAWADGDPLRTSLTIEALSDESTGGPWEGLRPKPGVDLGWDGMTQATFADPTTQVWLAHLAPRVLVVAATLIVILGLWRVLKSIRDGRAFTNANLRRIRGVAATLVVAPLLLVVPIVVRAAVLTDAAVETRGTIFTVTLPWQYLAVTLVGLLLAALAQAFEHGVELEDDVEGLV
ncbi:hypothetical protein GCM10022199_00450 [Marihabitans asiaticum]|uniref:DUF2975 family protein n=1 Tax=Marihabitans asiaticum TaxID=415218 RepID=A0A560WG58_9MICO|nr:DUF2975 domain-containing protein [Marihabitans asiaticum]TWD16672.1 DUF2975 family protein [Marihabitans asiaticum]